MPRPMVTGCGVVLGEPLVWVPVMLPVRMRVSLTKVFCIEATLPSAMLIDPAFAVDESEACALQYAYAAPELARMRNVTIVATSPVRGIRHLRLPRRPGLMGAPGRR